MVRKPRKRKLSDLSNSDFTPETRSSWKRNKRADLPRNVSNRHQIAKAAKRAAKKDA